ncbi:MAG: phosphoribosylglycinamide formyltransferase [Sphaerospermopsis sp. SIO1G2]|nr:phosphoribosylglycinamide formyltransferase [Sphaerospermopsis sp. SIO1G2]
MRPLKIAVLISGNGSNLQALLDDTNGDPHLHITLVISNNADAYGLQRATQAGVATMVVSHKDYSTRDAFDNALHKALTEHKIDLVCLAGFMRLLTPAFVERWRQRMLNIHPSLLPAYKGLNTHARVLADGQKTTGCTVHYVVADMDAGPIIAQANVAVHEDDTAHSLQQRVHEAEHRLYPQALRKAAAALPSSQS